MTDRQALNATFFAFRKRERSGVLLGATIAFVIGMVVLLGSFVGIFWTSVMPAVQWYGEIIAAAATNDTAAMQNVAMPPGLFTMFGALLLWLFPFYILCAAYEAACLRWMIHGESVGVMGLSLGAPTFRVWSTYWMWFLLNIAFSIAMSIVLGVMTGVFAASGDITAVAVALPVFYLVQYALMAYFAVRFAPAAATSVARRKFSFFQAWTVTKNRFWALLGSFVLVYLIYGIVSILIAVVWFSSVFGAAAPDLASAVNDPERVNALVLEVLQTYVQSLSQPQNWIVIGVLQVVGLILMAFTYLATYGINARAAQAALEEGKITPAT